MILALNRVFTYKMVMSKSELLKAVFISTLSKQPVFSQIVGLVNKSGFKHLVTEHDADRYSKQCGAWEHFICMLTVS